MWLKLGLVSCLLIHVEPQNQFYPPLQPGFNSNNIYYPDTFNVLPLQNQQSQTLPSQAVLDSIFNSPPKTKIDVEIEKSKEVSVSTFVENPTGRSLIPKVASQRPVSLQRPQNGQAAQIAPSKQTSGGPALQPTVPKGYNGLLYSVTNFGLNFLKNVNAGNNVVVSPYSITSLLALLQQGASGQTEKELSSVLNMPPPASAAAYTEMANDIKNRRTRNILRTANNIFISNNFELESEFERIARNNFDSEVTQAVFGNPERAARQINNWVSKRTNQKIDKIISADAIDSATQAVLVNAIYFKGIWDVPFRPDATITRDFHLSNGQTKPAQFMRTRQHFRTGTDPATNSFVVMLPFENNQYSMMFIMPENGISRALTSLTSEYLLSYFSFPSVDIELEIPKFSIKAETDLVSLLRNMGLPTMFGPYADLAKLGTFRNQSPRISSAVHSAVLSIDEQGGSAAAATSFAAVALSFDQPPNYKLNKPFIAVLWDTQTSLPLFMARIEEPLQ